MTKTHANKAKDLGTASIRGATVRVTSKPLQRPNAKRLAKQRETQIWILLSPKEAAALLAGSVPKAVGKQVAYLMKMPWRLPT